MRYSLEKLLEMWARWAQRGGKPPEYEESIIYVLGRSRGYLASSNNEPNDSLETSVEGAVALLSVRKPEAAFVLRVEYGAFDFTGLDPNARQIDKAHALGMPVRTYKNHLNTARSYVAQMLKVKK